MALPGERLSRAGGSLTEADLAAAEVFRLDDVDDDEAADALAAADRDGDGTLQREDDGARRRRRRGGRGRGRGGRGREDALAATDPSDPSEPSEPSEPTEIQGPLAIDALDEAEIEAEIEAEAEADELEDQAAALALATRGPRATPFGSVWDSQLGTSAGPTATNSIPVRDDEDFDEPEIPEYLIAEQRRGAPIGSGRGQGGPVRGGPRGGRAAYQSAMDRERFGRGGGGGINRYPDVSGRTGAVSGGGGGPTGSEANRGRAPRQDRDPVRRDGRPVGPAPSPRAPSPASSSEPWSEVPPELEAMLRSQVRQKPTERAPSARTLDDRATEAVEPAVDATSSAEVAEKPAPKRLTTRKTAVAPESEATASPVANAAETPAPKRRSTRKAVTATREAEAPADAKATAPPASRRRAVTAAAEATDKTAPRTRSNRTSAKAASDAMVPTANDEAAEKPAPKRRTPTRKPSASGSTESA